MQRAIIALIELMGFLLRAGFLGAGEGSVEKLLE
jgi:hypothetical protein